MPRRLILLILALLISGGTVFLAQQWLQGQLAGPRRTAAGTSSGATRPLRVLVAKTELPAGSLLTGDSLRWQVWPAGDPAAGYLTEGKAAPQDFAGAVVRARLTPGEPVTEGQIARPGERGFMAAVLTPGTRAITVNVEPNTGMAGFIMPGDRVDVILTLTVPSKGKEGSPRKASETVLSDLRVVAMDQTLSDVKKTDKKDISIPKTATLEVTPKQAEVLTVAADMGLLTLSLRSLARPGGDDGPDQQTHTWDAEAAKGILNAGGGGGGRRLVVVRGGAATETLFGSRGPSAPNSGAAAP